MIRIALILLMALAGSAWAGTIYEWKDPQTGKLMAGDKPPEGGVKYWKEGERNAPDPVMYKPPASTYEKYTVEDRIRKCSNGDTLDGKNWNVHRRFSRVLSCLRFSQRP